MSRQRGWDKFFMRVAHLMSERSTCIRRQVGAVAVKDRRIISTGYNGAPVGVSHCSEIGCLRKRKGIPSGQRHEICWGLHGEQNVIIQAAYFGVSLSGATLYCTTMPCFICAKMLVNVGISRLVVNESYPDDMTENLLLEQTSLGYEYINSME